MAHTHIYIYWDSIGRSFKHIYSDILSDILSGIYSGNLSDILSGIYSDILSGILSGIYSDIRFDSLSDILFGILSGIHSDILSDILPGLLSGILSGMSSGPSVPQHSELKEEAEEEERRCRWHGWGGRRCTFVKIYIETLTCQVGNYTWDYNDDSSYFDYNDGIIFWISRQEMAFLFGISHELEQTAEDSSSDMGMSRFDITSGDVKHSYWKWH